MAIVMRLDRMMADRKISLGELAERVGIADGNLSKIKNGKGSGVRFKTLNAICRELECQVGDLFEYVNDEDGDVSSDEASYAGL